MHFSTAIIGIYRYRQKLKKGNHFIYYYSKLSGGGKWLETLGVNNVYELDPSSLKILTKSMHETIIELYITGKGNQGIIVTREEMDEWNTEEMCIYLFEVKIMVFARWEHEGIISDWRAFT
jgi:hypothetical protein